MNLKISFDKKNGDDEIIFSSKVERNSVKVIAKFFEQNGEVVGTLNKNRGTIKIKANGEFVNVSSEWKLEDGNFYGLKAMIESSFDQVHGATLVSKLKISPSGIKGQVSNS